jgi:hypothetical protein
MGAKSWTKDEIEYLEDKYGTVSMQAISETLGRSVVAIQNKRQKMHLGAFLENGEYITWHQLCIALGNKGGSGYKNISWIKNRHCPVKYKTVDQCRFKVIYLDDFWKWAEENREFIDFTKMEPLILGKEPEWLKETRKVQWAKKLRYRTDPWTKLEDDKLRQMISEYKYSYDEISRELGRTCGAVQRRCCDLGIKGRPVKAENHNHWSDEEFHILADGINRKLPYEVIADSLPGRSTKAIRGRVFQMYKTEDINKAAAILDGGSWGDNRPDRLITDCTLNTKERKQVKDDISKFMGILKIRICNYFEAGDYWQRFICQNWNDGCEAGEDNCDECTSFIRIRPQYCKRCGKTFFERGENNFCPECREQRKKQHQHKYMSMHSKSSKNNDDLRNIAND